MFFQVEKDPQGNIKNRQYVSKEEIIKKHPSNFDIISWARGAMLNTKFSLTTKAGQFLYIRTNNKDLLK